ncbi:unnamed protein product [Durusdinium trenchii]|uniref:WW domain-containing protein n=2 Tax=Durusdinium trenchii TaxID=1381693 RepID=A0ABP0RP31_9DINO
MTQYHGTWSQLSPGELENVKLWTSDERSQYLQNQGIVSAKQDPSISRFLSDVLVDSGLPAPWMFRRDDEGNAFFWNQTSNETSWVHPLDLTLREVSCVFQTCLQLSPELRNNCINSLQESWEASITKMLSGWERAEDESGNVYYHNESREDSIWEHPSQVFLPMQQMKEQALNRMRDLAYLEHVGATPRKQGSKEVYEALKICKLKLADQISILSPQEAASTDSAVEAVDTEACQTQVEMLPEKQSTVAPEVPLPDPDPMRATTPRTATSATRTSTGEHRNPSSRERNGTAAKSVLRIASDTLQARRALPLPTSDPKLSKRPVLRSASESQINLGSTAARTVKRSLTEEKAWWWLDVPQRRALKM